MILIFPKRAAQFSTIFFLHFDLQYMKVFFTGGSIYKRKSTDTEGSNVHK